MAQLTTPAQLFDGDTSIVDTVAKHPLGTKAFDKSGNEYIYLLGVASTAAGSWVTYDEAFATTLLAANAIGPVAIAMAAIVASRYGWYQVRGKNIIASSDTTADDKPLFIDGTAGRVDDAVVTGDLVVGAFSRGSDSSNVLTVQINYPCVTDTLG